MPPSRLTCAAFAALALTALPAFAGQGAHRRHANLDRALADALASGERTQRVDLDNVVWGMSATDGTFWGRF